MADLDTPVSSLPSRPLEMEQALAQLEDSGWFEAIGHPAIGVHIDRLASKLPDHYPEDNRSGSE
jgi:hypothetical protein